MNELHEIKREIEVLSEQRSELWTRLSQGFDATVSTELKEIDARLNGLWDEHRAVKARLRFGDREKIIKRARHGGAAPPGRVERRHRIAGRRRGNPPCRLAYTSAARGVSSAGRASALQAEGHRFDPGTLHSHSLTLSPASASAAAGAVGHAEHELEVPGGFFQAVGCVDERLEARDERRLLRRCLRRVDRVVDADPQPANIAASRRCDEIHLLLWHGA